MKLCLAAQVITETESGKTYDFQDSTTLKNDLLDLFNQFKSGELKVKNKKVEQFERKNLTKRMAQVLNSCTASQQVSD